MNWSGWIGTPTKMARSTKRTTHSLIPKVAEQQTLEDMMVDGKQCDRQAAGPRARERTGREGEVRARRSKRIGAAELAPRQRCHGLRNEQRIRRALDNEHAAYCILLIV